MTKKRGCIFFDRDGVINEDHHYVSHPDDIIIKPGVVQALREFHKSRYLLIVVTNQSGIAQGIYTRDDMQSCHDKIQEECEGLFEHFYYAPGHPSVSKSLSRKPGSLLFEKAIARYSIEPKQSWMIGDKDRDLVPARMLGIRTIQVDHYDSRAADFYANSMSEAARIILSKR